MKKISKKIALFIIVKVSHAPQKSPFFVFVKICAKIIQILAKIFAPSLHKLSQKFYRKQIFLHKSVKISCHQDIFTIMVPLFFSGRFCQFSNKLIEKSTDVNVRNFCIFARAIFAKMISLQKRTFLFQP